jgi:hypothetical protein
MRRIVVLVGGIIALMLAFGIVRVWLFVHRPVVAARQLARLRVGMTLDDVQLVLGRRLILEKFAQEDGGYCVITDPHSLDFLSLVFDDQSKLKSYSVDRF